MSQPNRIKIVMDGGTAEVYGDFFSDMLNCYSNALYDRQKAAKASLAQIDLASDFRDAHIQNAVAEHDDSDASLKILEQVEKVFKNGSTHGGTRTVVPISYVQPERE